MRRLTSSSKSIQSIHSENDRKHVAQIIESCEQFAELLAKSSGLKKINRIDGNHPYANKFLHDLKPHSKENSPSQTSRVFVFRKQHGPVVVCRGRLQLKLDNFLDLVQLISDISVAGSGEDVLCFFFATDLHEPTG